MELGFSSVCDSLSLSFIQFTFSLRSFHHFHSLFLSVSMTKSHELAQWINHNVCTKNNKRKKYEKKQQINSIQLIWCCAVSCCVCLFLYEFCMEHQWNIMSREQRIANITITAYILCFRFIFGECKSTAWDQKLDRIQVNRMGYSILQRPTCHRVAQNKLKL